MAIYEVEKDSSGTPTGTKLVAGGTLYADSPIGTILPYGGASAPSDWFLCQGQSLSRTTYSELFAVIGTSFGVGDGSTTFNLPDMREAVPKGAGLTGKSSVHYDSDGVALGEFVEDRIKSHSHDFGNAAGTSLYVYSVPQGADGAFYANHVAGGSNSGATDNWYVHSTGSDTNEVKSVGVNYIIKAKQTAVPADFMSKVEELIIVRKGNWTIPTMSAGGTTYVNVTFDTPMPDTDYTVTIEAMLGGQLAVSAIVVNKTTTGFMISLTRLVNTALSRTVSANYTAVKYNI